MIIPDSYGSMVQEFNACHTPAGSSAGGQFCAAGATWKPEMTRQEAMAWASAQGAKYYEGTTVVSSEARGERIRAQGFELHYPTTWGRAVYIGFGKDSEAFYKHAKRHEQGPTSTLLTAAAVKRPLVLSYAYGMFEKKGSHNIPKSLAGVLTKSPGLKRQWDALYAKQQTQDVGDPDRVFDLAVEVLKMQGYDSILIVQRPVKGSRRLTIDPMVDYMKDEQLMDWISVGGSQLVVFDPKQVTVVGQRPARRVEDHPANEAARW